MKSVFIIVGIILLAIAIFAVYRLITVKRQNSKLNAKRFDRIKPLYDKLETGQTLTTEEILPYAKNLLTRETTFQLLNEHNKTELFPKEYNTLIKGAESNLANWLEFPTELDACPDEIEHIKRVTFDFDGQNNFVHYEVFKYRVNEPHWAAKDGWILGVVGPYFDDSKPYDFPQATFSRVSSTVDKVTPNEEARWVHENISLKR
jgi:diadenosine tetraphosphatase ApaH/serine/threonine PP2A family protein phosphatase